MERRDRLTWRAAGPVLAAATAGLLFAPVFGLPPLLVPVAVPALAVLATIILCGRRPDLVDWRPLLATLAGLLAVSETLLFGTTVAGLPTGRTLAALAGGVTDSWRLVLESTWPARAEASLLIFVPLLVVVAAVLGAELVLRLRSKLGALLPSLVVVVLSQFYAALAPGPAVIGALGYAVAAAVTLATATTLVRLVAAGAVSVLIAGSTLILLPETPARFSLQDGRPAPVVQTAPANPLDEIADRMANPDLEVFRTTKTSSVDRWSLVVLDDFDGINWNPSRPYRWMGRELRPGPQVTVPTRSVSAWVTVTNTGGPWLPSQPWPAAVDGLTPAVVPEYGTLMRQDEPSGPAQYELRWSEPQVDAKLRTAPIDKLAPGGFNGVGEVPPEVETLARTAMRNVLPSFQGALVLEDYLRANYHPATGEDVPTGHGWRQLENFLITTKNGTSEQFAAAYVVLARIVGIPARLVVGYRVPDPEPDGTIVVCNRNVLAWPEVAVQGVGWVALDPIASASGTATVGGGLAGETSRAREKLSVEELAEAPVAPLEPSGPGFGPGRAGVPWVALPLGLLLGWLAGVPALWTIRAWRRRRRSGAAAALGAWSEVRDRLRAYGVVVTPGMTVRDLGAAAGPVADAGTVAEIRTLAGTVDRMLWSGGDPSAEDVTAAWASVRAVRRGLARRDRTARVRALLDPRPLLPPVTAGSWRPGWPWARS